MLEIVHSMDCFGAHRLMDKYGIGEHTSYENPAVLQSAGKLYLAVTEYWAGDLEPHTVYELSKDGIVTISDQLNGQPCNLHRPDEQCTHQEVIRERLAKG